jgi:hypothetical protein
MNTQHLAVMFFEFHGSLSQGFLAPSAHGNFTWFLQKSAKNHKLILAQQADLNALLNKLGQGQQLKRIHSEAVSLHDIYLRAVGHRDMNGV